MLLVSQFSHVPFFMDLHRICSHANERHFIIVICSLLAEVDRVANKSKLK